MVATTPCPDLQSLQEFVLGKLPEPSAEQLESHLAACGRCVAALQSLRTDDQLLDAMRQQSGGDATPHAAVQQLMEKLSRLPQVATHSGEETASDDKRSSHPK